MYLCWYYSTHKCFLQYLYGSSYSPVPSLKQIWHTNFINNYIETQTATNGKCNFLCTSTTFARQTIPPPVAEATTKFVTWLWTDFWQCNTYQTDGRAGSKSDIWGWLAIRRHTWEWQQKLSWQWNGCGEHTTCAANIAVFVPTCGDELRLLTSSRADSSEALANKNTTNSVSVPFGSYALKEWTSVKHTTSG